MIGRGDEMVVVCVDEEVRGVVSERVRVYIKKKRKK